ncbi:MAG: class I SAM-dependent methyltransferase [Deltaproteobacteria bacterium]|nr:class I SAM-dependent methyltransferase [Deltaproteobacteria bacterium]
MISPRQNKEYEITFFDSVAANGHYELLSESLYSTIFATMRRQELLPEGAALECGCGTGAFGRRFLSEFPQISTIVGVDISQRMIDVCRSQTITRYDPLVGDLEDRSLFSPDQFSMVICPFILHHFPTIDLVTANISHWTKPSGLLVLIEPNGSSPVSRLFKSTRRILERLLGPEWVIKHRLATPNETDHPVHRYRDSLKKNGYELVSLRTFTISQRIKDPASFAGIISRARWILIKLFDRILRGTDYSGSTVLIMAKKLQG